MAEEEDEILSVGLSEVLTRRPLSVSSPRAAEADAVLLDEPVESDDSTDLPTEADSVLELKVEGDLMIGGTVVEGAGVADEEVPMIGLVRTDEVIGPTDGPGEAEERSAEADVVDLTGEDSEDEESVVDLTSTMSSSTTFVSIERDLLRGPYLRQSSQDPVILDQHSPHPLAVTTSFPALQHYHDRPPPPLPSSDDTDDVILVSSYNPTPSHATNITSSSPSPVTLAPHISRIISCPICMETQKNFTEKGHSLVTTKCGHLFCDHCLKKAISLSRKCPTCSSRLTSKQFHRIYI